MTDWETRYYEAEANHTEANGMLTAENERLKRLHTDAFHEAQRWKERYEEETLRHQSGKKPECGCRARLAQTLDGLKAKACERGDNVPIISTDPSNSIDAFYYLIQQIEKCGASPDLTEAVVMAMAVRDRLRKSYTVLMKAVDQGAEECVHQVGNNVETYTAADIRAVLAVHWLTEVRCQHEDKTDRSFCWCGSFQSEPQPSVGAAVTRWIEHVMAQLPQHRAACEFVAGKKSGDSA